MKRISAILIAMLLVIGSNPVEAALIQISNSAPLAASNFISTGDFGPGGAFVNNNILSSSQLNGFDSSLGTLVSVVLGFETTFTLEHNLMGRNVGEPGPIRAASQGTQAMQVNFRPVGLDARRIQINPFVLGDCDNDPRESLCSTTEMLAGNFNGEFVTADILDSFVDRSLFVGYVNTLFTSHTCFGGEDTCKSTSISTWTGTVSVTYTYDDGLPDDPDPDPAPVSEPATLALVGIGLMGIGLARRRRSR